MVVRGAKPGDVVAIDLIELTPFGEGKSAILRDFGVLRREFPEPVALPSPVHDGRARFGGRIPLPLNPNLGTISTMPPEGYKPSYAGAYGGRFRPKGCRPGEPGLSAGSCRRRAGFLRRSARRHQRRDHYRHRHRMQHECASAHHSPEKPSACAARSSLKVVRFILSGSARASKKPPKTPLAGRSTSRSRAPSSAGRRPTCCSASSVSCAWVPRRARSWQRG